MATNVATSSGLGSVIGKQEQARASLSSNTETFLKLLTTQLKNQDPLSPMDSTAFIDQTFKISAVEQTMMTNDLLTALVAMNDQGLGEASQFLGETVYVYGDTQTTSADGGDMVFNYELPRDAQNLKFEIVNEKGLVLRTMEATRDQLEAGPQIMAWDGKTDSGAQMLGGVKTKLRITATDWSGREMTPTISYSGEVREVRRVDGVPMLNVNGNDVKVSDIIKMVAKAPAPEPAAA